MQARFEKVSAVAKGFLTRCLVQSDKVQELVKTIKVRCILTLLFGILLSEYFVNLMFKCDRHVRRYFQFEIFVYG